MGLSSRLQQWVYARPRVAVAGSILLLLLVGAGGWESARMAFPGATQSAVAPVSQGVVGARMIQVEAAVGPITRVVHRTRTITAPSPTKTVVRRRTRTLRDTHTVRDVVTVTDPNAGRAQPAYRPAAATRPVRILTVTTVQTETETKTVTQPPVTVTEPPVTVTVFVTTTKGRGH